MAARRNHMGARCVPIAEARTAIFSVCFGENRRSKLVFRSLGYATADARNMNLGGNLQPI